MHVTGNPGHADVQECCAKPWRSLLREVRAFTESVPRHVRTNGRAPPAAEEEEEEEEGEEREGWVN